MRPPKKEKQKKTVMINWRGAPFEARTRVRVVGINCLDHKPAAKAGGRTDADLSETCLAAKLPRAGL